MPVRLTLRLAEYALAILFAIVIFLSWREDRRDRSQLAAQLAAAQQSLNEASARQHDRDAQLNQTLADLAAQKRTVVTPTQILRALPNDIPLPAPITLQADHASSQSTAVKPTDTTAAPAGKTAGASSATPPDSPIPTEGATLGSPGGNTANTPSGGASPAPANATTTPSNGAFIPEADLKPLYDFALDCKACQARLTAAQNDLADEKTKTVTLTQERDAAVRAAKGGSPWRRFTRAAKWFFIGAAAGAIAATAHH
jgi:hypothetical protein